jgi:hypothetical protein
MFNKSGGILATARGLMIVMHWINRKQLERKITKFLKKEKAQAETLEDVSSPREDHHEKYISKRKTFNI